MKKYLKSSKPYIIAETAYTFEGDKDYLITQTNELGENINAIKYHILFNLDEYMVKEHSIYGLVKNWVLCESSWIEVLTNAKRKGLDTVILADDVQAIEFCIKNNELIDVIEIHSACVNDINLLDKAIEFSKEFCKVFAIGISGFEIQELLDIVEYLRDKNLEDVLLMYGFQNFPTEIKEIRLARISILNEMLGYKVGYADHTKYNDPFKEQIIYTSYSMGANIQEVHYVLNEGEERIDYITGLDSNHLDRIKENLDMINLAKGSPDFRLNEGEKKYLNFRKVPTYSDNFKKGHILSNDDIKFKRVEFPAKQHKFNREQVYLGKSLSMDVVMDTEIQSHHLL